MSGQVWSFGLVLGAAIAQWIIGNKKWWGQLIALALQPGWVVIGMAIEQYWMCAHAALFIFVYSRNLRIWLRLRHAEPVDQYPVYPAGWHSRTPMLPAWAAAQAWATEETAERVLVQTSSQS